LVIVLETINTDLTNLNILGGATGIEGSEDDDVEEELPPPPDAEIGDSMNLTEAEDGEAEHFIATCPGVINEAPGGSGDTYLHCEEEEDEVSELELQCSGSSCTCNYSAGGNRGFCMSKCQTADRAGYKFVKANDQPNQILECVFAEQNELSECSNFFVTCLSNMVGSSCEVDASRVCRVETSGNNTNFYYFE
jgi:hypothetical protein